MKLSGENRSGGGGNLGSDSDDDGDSGAGHADSHDEGNRHAWTYCGGRLVNYIVHELISRHGGHSDERLDYFSAELRDELSLTTAEIDVDDTDSVDEALGAGTPRPRAPVRKRRKNSPPADDDGIFMEKLGSALKDTAPTYARAPKALDDLARVVENLDVMIEKSIKNGAPPHRIAMFKAAQTKAEAELGERISQM